MMRWLLKGLFVVILLGAPFWWGYAGMSVIAPIAGVVLVDGYMVTTGWRYPHSGAFKSAIMGAMYAAIAVFPAYLLGRYFG